MVAIDYRMIPTDELCMNEYEAAKRLHTVKGFEMTEIDQCFEDLKKVVSCRFSAVRVPVIYMDDNRIDCGFGEFRSEILKKNLKESQEAFIFAATLGMGVDRLLNQLSLLSPARHFITDALASALAEAAVDKTEELVKGKILCRPRFSPGFGDLSLELQPRILNLLNAQKLLGITTGSTHMMSPTKSVTAIMGIRYE